jgi:hypothetical protein
MIGLDPSQYILYNNIILYIKNKKNSETNFKKSFKKFVVFSCIFLSILINIGLYFYTVKIQIRY